MRQLTDAKTTETQNSHKFLLDQVADQLENSIRNLEMVSILLIHAEPNRVDMGEAGWSVSRLSPETDFQGHLPWRGL